MSKPDNMHATALVVGDRGILIRGSSGSGKTTLALAIMERARRIGAFARLVADDQIHVEPVSERLVASAPFSIRGLVEVYGRTPTGISSLDSAVIDLVLDLVPKEDAPRYREEASVDISGCRVASLILEAHAFEVAWPAIASVLGLLPFD